MDGWYGGIEIAGDWDGGGGVGAAIRDSLIVLRVCGSAGSSLRIDIMFDRLTGAGVGRGGGGSEGGGWANALNGTELGRTGSWGGDNIDTLLLAGD